MSPKPIPSERSERTGSGFRESLPGFRESLPTDPASWVRLREDTAVVTHLSAPSFAAEQYRALAVQVEERLNPISTWGYALTVTSAEESAGKTLTSLNLALALARGEERRVLLVEADLWRPQLFTYLDSSASETAAADLPGLLQVIEGTQTLPEAVLRVFGTSLDVLTSGGGQAQGDVLSGRRMSEILTEMRAAYEIVVIDSPPMSLLASARSLAARSDGSVLVVRAGQSKRQGIERALQVLGPEKMIGMVFNGARPPRRGYRSYDRSERS